MKAAGEQGVKLTWRKTEDEAYAYQKHFHSPPCTINTIMLDLSVEEI